MEDFMAAAAQVVGGAVLQEIVSRGASLVLGKRKDKASQGQYQERLKKAVHEVEFVLERTAKLPITEVSLLRGRIELKRDFIQAGWLLLNKNKKSKTPQALSSGTSFNGKLSPTEGCRQSKSAESTDIAGVAMDCLQSLASQFKFVADTAMGELTLLANLQDFSHSNAPPWLGIQEDHYKIIRMCRPDPLCCKARGHGPCANTNSIESTELSHILPEEVILFKFKCYISALEYTSRSSSHEAGKRSVTRDQRPPLKLTVSLHPHYVHDERLQANYTVEVIGDNHEECIDVSIQQVSETVRSNSINCFLQQPQITKYSIRWVTKHGIAKFDVKKRKHIKEQVLPKAGPRPEQMQRQSCIRGHRQRRLK
ncbi:unnamed protein product [Urochloa decumbens]|uniref:Rx N-terminal domain-containing protein n=1 Tax=Urochloa decumbens TaxID=240449 RepID=A0ABC9FM37_9POAL